MNTPLILVLLLFAQISYAANHRNATAILLDTSRSIGLDDFQRAKTAVREVSNTTQTSGVLFVYVFGRKLKQINPEQLADLKPTESGTSIFDSAFDVAGVLVATGADRKTLLIFSDGYDTTSATTLEDLISYASQQGIAIHGVGLRRNPNRSFLKTNRKVLQRLAKLTGGQFFSVGERDLAARIRSTIIDSSDAHRPPAIVQEQKVEKPVVQSSPVRLTAAVTLRTKDKSAFPYSWIVIAGVMLGFIAFMLIRNGRKTVVCPDCGQPMQANQTSCNGCSVSETQIILPPAAAKKRHNIGNSVEQQPVVVSATELAWFDKKESTQEVMTGTDVLVDTPTLVVQKGADIGHVYFLKPDVPVSLGRSRLNEIRLDDRSVSAQHCRIVSENEKVVIYDLVSTNGTFVNETKIATAVLHSGDIIKIGQTQLLFKIEQARYSPSSSQP